MYISSQTEKKQKVIFVFTCSKSIWCNMKSFAKSVWSFWWQTKGNVATKTQPHLGRPPPAPHVFYRDRNKTRLRARYGLRLTVNGSHGLASHQTWCLIYSRIFSGQKPQSKPMWPLLKPNEAYLAVFYIIYHELKVLKLVSYCIRSVSILFNMHVFYYVNTFKP